jgi:subfamily B ATP-binding cassette protein MsbA
LAIITFIGAASPAARAIGSFNTVLNEAVAALGRVFALLDEQPRIVDRPDAVPLALRGGRVVFDGVSCRYGDRPALTDVSFVAEPGQTIALVGSSGAGKSTVLNLIPRLYDVSGGRVLIDGQDVRAVTLASLRAQVAVVSQDISLFAGTIGENIRFGRPGASEDDIRAAAEAAAAHGFIMAQPGGYNRRIGMGGEGLAGGERQRIALARAFLKDAPILLLDEATSALDADTEAQVQEALARLAKGRTTLVVAHRLSTIRDADQILVFEQGRIVERGSHGELTAHGGVYARLKSLQTAEAGPARG